MARSTLLAAYTVPLTRLRSPGFVPPWLFVRGSRRGRGLGIPFATAAESSCEAAVLGRGNDLRDFPIGFHFLRFFKMNGQGRDWYFWRTPF